RTTSGSSSTGACATIPTWPTQPARALCSRSTIMPRPTTTADSSRVRNDPNLANPASARTVLTIDHHAATNHNGGQLQFGPDRDLYIGVGDGGNEGDPHNYGQNTGVLLGKLLRIAPRPSGGYTIPRGNP